MPQKRPEIAFSCRPVLELTQSLKCAQTETGIIRAAEFDRSEGQASKVAISAAGLKACACFYARIAGEKYLYLLKDWRAATPPILRITAGFRARHERPDHGAARMPVQPSCHFQFALRSLRSWPSAFRNRSAL